MLEWDHNLRHTLKGSCENWDGLKVEPVSPVVLHSDSPVCSHSILVETLNVRVPFHSFVISLVIRCVNEVHVLQSDCVSLLGPNKLNSKFSSVWVLSVRDGLLRVPTHSSGLVELSVI